MTKHDSIDPEVNSLARVLWDYLCIWNDLKPSDFILALGSHDTRVAECAADLFQRGLGKWFIASGGFGKVTKSLWKVQEAIRFAEIAANRGVPRDKILTETTATNTGDNIAYVRKLVEQTDRIPHKSGIIVAKPYMTRRALATARRQWPSVNWAVTAPKLTYDEYPDHDVPIVRMVNLLVGDLQRMKIYADQGFQEPEEIPEKVWAAYEQLVQRGFNQFVVR